MCSECMNLDINDKYEGYSNGCIYYCKKRRMYVDAIRSHCDDFNKTSRSKSDIETIIQGSKDYCDARCSVGFYNFAIIVLIILFIVIYFIWYNNNNIGGIFNV